MNSPLQNERKLERDVVHPQIEGAIESFELAFRMQSEVPGVLDLRDEPDSVLKLYGIGQGKDQFARQCLLARRMAAAGVRFIEIASTVAWDHHNLLKDNLAANCAATDRAHRRAAHRLESARHVAGHPRRVGR